MTATKKYLSIQYRKNGNEYIAYSIADDEGNIKDVSPIQWTKLKLPDVTSEYQSKECYSLLANGVRNKLSFGRFLDLVNDAKKQGIEYRNQAKEFYLFALTKI